MTTKIENCQLEVDGQRGVIYVHSPLSFTHIRICGLTESRARVIPPLTKFSSRSQLDISLFGDTLVAHSAVEGGNVRLDRTGLAAGVRIAEAAESGAGLVLTPEEARGLMALVPWLANAKEVESMS